MPTREIISDEQGAWLDLGENAVKPYWLERNNILPFSVLSDDAFEICCFLLLLREHPDDRIYYYGKTGDLGRDVVRHHADGTVEFVQCKRYTNNVDVGDVRAELAKLCVNTFENKLPEPPDRVTFYVVPELTSGAQDLLASQDKWRQVAPQALEKHLGRPPEPELIDFANKWWPKIGRVAGAGLSARVEAQPTLVERFFGVRKVIDGSVSELQTFVNDQLQAMEARLFTKRNTDTETAGANTPLTKAQEIVGRSRDKLWEERARRSLDAQGLKLWEDIRADIRGLNRIRAIDSGKQLKEWFQGDGRHASPTTRGRVCILLADLAVIESGLSSLHERVDVSEANAWLTRATDELGDSPLPEDAARLVYLGARIDWLIGDSEAAIRALEATEDANCTSLALSILITEGKDEQAVTVARSLPHDVRWSDRMVLAFARAGQTADAQRVINWSREQSDPAVYARCRIAWAQGTLQRLFRDREQKDLFCEPLKSGEEQVLRELQKDLEPLLAAAVSREALSGGTEVEALEVAFVLARVLGQRERWERYGAILAKATPVSPEYARAVCRGDLVAPPDLPKRLRADYQRSFTAGHMAAAIEALGGADFALITRSAEALTPLAETDEQKEQVVGLLLERAFAEEGNTAIEQARSTAERLLGEGHPLVRLIECESLRRADKLEESARLLQSNKDETSPLWLQLAAAHAHRRGDVKEAAGHLLRAAHLLGRRETYWQAFSLARKSDDADVMREVMQALSRLTPEDPTVSRNLAAIDFRAGRYRDAIDALHRADALTPGTAEIGLFLGQALALAGRGEEAVQVLDRVCAAHPAELPPHHLRALVQDSLGKPQAAFDSLHAARERFWGDMTFVLAYHTFALKVNREQEAHLAFLRIHELQAGDPNGPLRPGTIEDFFEMVRRDRTQHEQFNRELLAGLLPWRLVGRALRREAYLDWAIRTQDTFVPDAPVARAEYAVYATNGLCVRGDGDGGRSLEMISAAPPANPVVADLSALLTLHRLGLLDRALTYFGRVVVPAGYAARFLEESRSLQPHQASQIEARRAILAAVDQGRLRAASQPSESAPTPTPVLDEHHLDEVTVDYHLIDAVEWLRRTGRVSEAEVTAAGAVCDKQPMDPALATFPAAAITGLRVSVPTLTTVHGLGLLERFIASMRLHLGQDEIEQLRRELLSVERRGELTRWTRELHSLLTTDPRVETAEPVRTREPEAEGEPDSDPDPTVDSFLLASQRNLPLLADDRFLQSNYLNLRRGEPGAAFGTDALLTAFARDGAITVEEKADAWVQLARWRYRFLIPDPEVLLALAGRHPGFLPGVALREVCRYVHDCCLDPGLFCGMEPVQPPVSVGWRYFQRVLQTVGHFLIRAWHDPRFDQAALMTLTHWVATELVPPPPRQLPHAGYVVASDSIPRIILVSALTEATLLRNPERSGVALEAIADAFGIDPDVYEETVALMVEQDANLPDVPGAEAAGRLVRRLTASLALGHRPHIGIRVATAVADLGLIETVNDPVEEAEASAIGDPSHPRRLPLPNGPWVFIRAAVQGEASAARYVPDLLFHPNSSVRCAAVTHLAAADWLTPRSRDTLSRVTPDILSEEGRVARPAARAAEAALRRDLLLSLARFRQARASRMEDENAMALRGLLEPQWDTLAAVPADRYRPPAAEWADFRRESAGEPSVGRALDRYYERYGHLPLASPFAIEEVVRAWTAAHGTEGVWAAVREWADDDSRPLAWYHACRVFLAIPALVPEDARAESWADVTAVLGGFTAATNEQPLRSYAWALVHALAKHYLQVLEVGSHEENATALAALAWWAAERVTRQLIETAVGEHGPEAAVEVIRRIVEEALRPLNRRSTVSWILGRPSRPPSALAYGTVFFNSIWRPSLLEAGPGPDMTVPAEHAESISAALVLALATGFPAQSGHSQSPTLAVEVGFAHVTHLWGSVLPDVDRADDSSEPRPGEMTGGDLQETVEAEQVTSSEPVVVAHIRDVWDWEPDTRVMPLQRLGSAIGLGGVSPAQLRWLLDDREWWDHTFSRLAREDLDALCVSLLELVRSGGEEWQLALPHRLRAQALREEVGSQAREVAAGAVIQASIITGNREAVTLLVHEGASPDLSAAFAEWRQRLTHLLLVVPPPVQARIRTTLAVLPHDR